MTDPADWIAIRELTALSNRAFDDNDGAAFAAGFTADAEFVIDGAVVAAGHAALAELGGTPSGSRHLTAEATIEVTGDEAAQVCTLLLLQVPRDRSGVRMLTTGRYDDRLVRTPEGWLFRRREVVLDADLGGGKREGDG